ncbi:lamin tail domain-containing protein [Congregibacter sp.]|jgi:hypothetical protein|uniref:lamin tail domain-containing protein n=1 Tax=Congregibacter sp. TaxID=2744308 RepID=UPI0039E4B0FA
MMTSQNPTLDSSAKDSLARIPSRLKRLKPSKAKLALGALGAMLAAINTALAGPILTEIHYNGLANGSDPDEFIELTNPGEFTLDLSAWQFTQGINYSFAQGQTLAPATSLLIARDPSGFLEAFPEYQGDIFDFSGALSNSGETLTLADAAGIEVWSISYDDTAPWPRSPDGLGDSLQLITDALDAGIASNWKAQSPSPGSWGALSPTPITVPAPASIALLVAGAVMLRVRRTTQRLSANLAPKAQPPRILSKM